MNETELQRIEDEAKAGKAHPQDVLALIAEVRRQQGAVAYRLAKDAPWGATSHSK